MTAPAASGAHPSPARPLPTEPARLLLRRCRPVDRCDVPTGAVGDAILSSIATF